MTAIATHKMNWTDVYDTNLVVQDADLSDSGPALFVDIGGAHGLDSARFLAKHPELPTSAKIVVQDLPEVVSTHAKETLSPRIQRMAYDFFQPQPLLGARAYFLHARTTGRTGTADESSKTLKQRCGGATRSC